MYAMFKDNSAFNQPISNWDVSNVHEMWYIFLNASNFNQPIGDWAISSALQCVGFSDNTPQWTLPHLTSQTVFHNVSHSPYPLTERPSCGHGRGVLGHPW